MKDVDEALSDYLETYEADEIFNDHFSGIRRAFIAGFKAAGGEVPPIQPVFRIIRSDHPPK
ncbi:MULTISPECIES: hypothetical protein [Eubacteriales]|jgi:hypothetical protein|uniref:Uncharacterized protein n=1 Tax=Caproicibacterium amylolyticum TaxID=2766537 RepID=A0A7G9WG13_9FIRM|nr:MULTISPECIES: hypothetical protein [Eubacteriales]QNO17625.1 hypothetical protein H6X83_11925 [Caproicibacterium amylolyticum]